MKHKKLKHRKNTRNVEYDEKIKVLNYSIDKGEESQINDIGQVLNKIIDENISKLRKDIPMQI